MGRSRGNLPAEIFRTCVFFCREVRAFRYWQDELGSSNALMHIIASVLTDGPDNIFISLWDMFWCGNLSVCSVALHSETWTY
jgi:hypothetical protein